MDSQTAETSVWAAYSTGTFTLLSSSKNANLVGLALALPGLKSTAERPDAMEYTLYHRVEDGTS
ncbi:hypothetical protein GCM10009628_02570 [Paeniglutamicibacter kerguelensis]